MAEKLYGGHCHICAHMRHQGEQADPVVPWLSMQPMECNDCSSCQEAALSRHIEASGLYLFDGPVRDAVKALRDGKPHPLIETLRKECISIDENMVLLTLDCGCVEPAEENPDHPWEVGEGTICLVPEHAKVVSVVSIDARSIARLEPS